jgi:hypothetical protein
LAIWQFPVDSGTVRHGAIRVTINR